MATNDSLLFITRLVRQKHDALIAASTALFNALPGDDPVTKKAAAANMQQAANDLRAVVANSDVPEWLANTVSYLGLYIADQWNAAQFLGSYIPLKALLETHIWVFEESPEVAFDFDSIFEHFKNESRLPELFNEIVRILEEIQNSGDVDSITMLRSLGKVIATIKRSQNGSYFSLKGTWDFLLSFLNNYLWGELVGLPAFGTALAALQKTIHEMDDEMFKVHNQIKEEMARTVGQEIKYLESKSDFPSVTYNKSGRLLPDISANQLTDALA